MFFTSVPFSSVPHAVFVHCWWILVHVYALDTMFFASLFQLYDTVDELADDRQK